MALTVKQLVNRHGAFVSAVTGFACGVAILLGQLLQYFVGLVSSFSVGQGSVFPLTDALLLAVPFAVGFFVSLWIIAPIAEELGLAHVITRAILATGVASTIVFIVLGVTGFVHTVGFESHLLGDVPGALGRALTSAVLTFISTLPLGILAGVLLWLWRKDHPPRHPLSGLIDEV